MRRWWSCGKSCSLLLLLAVVRTSGRRHAVEARLRLTSARGRLLLARRPRLRWPAPPLRLRCHPHPSPTPAPASPIAAPVTMSSASSSAAARPAKKQRRAPRAAPDAPAELPMGRYLASPGASQRRCCNRCSRSCAILPQRRSCATVLCARSLHSSASALPLSPSAARTWPSSGRASSTVSSDAEDMGEHGGTTAAGQCWTMAQLR